MFCTECGKKNANNTKFCPYCGKKAKETIVETQYITENVVEKSQDNEQIANTLCTISVSLYFGMPVLTLMIYILTGGFMGYSYGSSAIGGFITSITSILSSMARIAAYILMIVARVKCPNNIFGKILMWVYIALIAMGIFTSITLATLLIWFLIYCGSRF